MTDRDIRYCTTEDGANVAFCVEGDGPTTILALPAFFESFSLDHLMPVYKQFYADLGAGRRVIRFDWRGTGLSGPVPDTTDSVFAGSNADLLAVAQAARQPCVLFVPTIAGPGAMQFVANHPELVSHLILYGTYAAVTDAFSDDLLDGFKHLVSANWQMASQAIADTNGRREFPDEAAQLGDWYFRSITRERYLQIVTVNEGNPQPDVEDQLAEIRVPTLVLHRLADPVIPISAGQKLAAAIPGARFIPLAGEGHLFCLGDYGPILAAIDAHIGDRVSAAGPAGSERVASDLRTVLFTDLVGHTEMMSRLGDKRGRDVLREHERITREVLKANGGAEVKTMGDGFMASFGSVTKAVECAVALQRAFASHDGEALLVRVGLNAGEPIEEDGDLFGATVILASRIAAKAEGGEILVADTVRGLCSGKGFVFSDRGEFVAKGFEEPVRVYEVGWGE